MAVQLPTPPTDVPDWTVRVALEGATYQFRYLWNERDNHWSLGISTEDGTSIVAGRRVVVGWDMLLSVSNESAPTGALICVATEDPLNLAGTGDIDPGLTDLGSRCDILYYTLAELVA